MQNKQTLIDYLKYEGATADEAEHTYNVIINRIAEGESRIDVLQELSLPIDLADLL